MSDELRVLLIEDNPGDVRLIEEMLDDAAAFLRRIGDGANAVDRATVDHAGRLDDGLDRLAEATVDVILLDLGLPDSDGLETLEAVVAATEFVPIVVLTGLRDEQIGIEAIQHGAQDYLVKNEVTSDLLVRSIHHAIERNRQAREESHRREQLTVLNTLTRELMNVESTEELLSNVVETAERTLDLRVFGVALYDAQTATLSLDGATDAAESVVETRSLFEAEGGAGWRAFTEGTVRRLPLRDAAGEAGEPNDEAESSESGEPNEEGAGDGVVSELVLFPLASHGVLFAGATTDGGFNEAAFEFVETVAGTVEAALDRVDRERQLQERERALEAQNRSLARLTRVNDIIRNIDRALVRASTRDEIETVVCEQLAGVGPYELAWIGERNAVADVVTPRVSAGNEKGYLDGIDIRTDGSLEALGPTGRAFATNEPQVVNDVVSDPSFEPWRNEALSRGYYATIALPLSYDETLYGVLNVYAAQSDVFGELEQAVLTELADNIAYAINAVERKKALVSSAVTHLEFRVTDPALEAVTLTSELDCEYAVETVFAGADGGVRSFFTTRGVPANDVLAFAPRLPFDDLTLVSESEEADVQACLFDAELGKESLEATVLEHGGRPHAISAADGTATVVIELAADAAVSEFVTTFRSRYPDAELVAKRTHERSQRTSMGLRESVTETLTDRQLEALQTAHFSGYFEAPRVRNSTEIADSMGISQPTFNHHLRAAMRKVAEHLFQAETLGS